ncbi:UvrD-helicase domain-containing protein [Microvirga sp. 2YAF29]|uniref:UvrD-helicase domain-containing protein n=1 Tax=Microvirga sp. 2YAF29 TaxID=3233031 RepID=UPI003F9C9B21
MSKNDIDLLSISKGLIVAPAGCGKTQLIADALQKHDMRKPILVLTHTNAGVAALRIRLDRAGIRPTGYRISTIDGWAVRLISAFPERSGHDPAIILDDKPNYRGVRTAAYRLLKAGHISDIIEANYCRLIVDEYQDCSLQQHAIVYEASKFLPTCILGDPMQSIFGFGDDPLANWDDHVCGHFPKAGELQKPWRWINAEAEDLGRWLLFARDKLQNRQSIDLQTAPASVNWVSLNGSAEDHTKRMNAGRVEPPGGVGSVLIIGDSTNPASQQKFAGQTPGAITVEAVDLRDLVTFARDLDPNSESALTQIANFAQSVMTNVGASDLVRRVEALSKGSARKEATMVERAALTFLRERTYRSISDMLVEINKEAGVRAHRPAVLRACLRALQLCSGQSAMLFRDASIQVREQSRVQGRPLPKRAVGSTLLLKGLEAEVSVILNANALNARNLYVAMTRGSKNVLVCSTTRVLTPPW